jgi:hypothetical protein
MEEEEEAKEYLTFLLGSKTSLAWSRDMTGLSNQALSLAPTRPLLGLFEARPICIAVRSGWRFIVRSEGRKFPFRGVSVTNTERALVWEGCVRHIVLHGVQHTLVHFDLK